MGMAGMYRKQNLDSFSRKMMRCISRLYSAKQLLITWLRLPYVMSKRQSLLNEIEVRFPLNKVPSMGTTHQLWPPLS